MKILMQNRASTFSIPGGDTVQMVKTKEYLEKLGVSVDINLDLEPDVSKYDVVHLFNILRVQETYIQILNARRYKKPVVVSNIYWNNSEYEHNAFKGLRKLINDYAGTEFLERIKGVNRIIRDKEFNKASVAVIMKGRKNLQKVVIKNTDMFLPNAYGEILQMERDFNIKIDKYIVAPNSIDTNVFKLDNKRNNEYEKYRDCVLCVARIDPRKCMVNLIEAVNQLNLPLVIVGKASATHNWYYKEVLKHKTDNITIISGLPHEELNKLYNVAKVHALVSWYETPGLTNLEAGVCGCNLVMTDKGTTKEYFKEYVSYCDPDNIDSIKGAILKEYNKPKSDLIRKHILSNFTWEITADRTLEAYTKVLSSYKHQRIGEI